jgi:L-ascorbate metabolism protein UlaG (beta-lactamase superfamily)
MRIVFQSLVAATALMCATAVLARPFFDPRAEKQDAIDVDPAFAAAPRDPACATARLVATGGAAPRDAHTLAARWAGFSNFELAYNGKVILLDAYFDRGGNYPSLGFAAADVKRADLIMIGHGHFDHMSDAASVGIQTGAPIVGAPLTTDKLASQKVPATQLRTVTGKGGELLRFDGFTVEPILARHGQPDPRVTSVIEGALSSLSEPNPALDAEERPIRARGVSDPRVITEGTIAYLITLDDGFRIMYRDSGGRVTDAEKAAMARAGGVDLALVAVAGGLSLDAHHKAGAGAYPHLSADRLHAGASRRLLHGRAGHVARNRAAVPGRQGRQSGHRYGVAELSRAGMLQHRVQPRTQPPLTGYAPSPGFTAFTSFTSVNAIPAARSRV